VSLLDLSVVARWTIAPRLMGVPGVSNVAVWGLRDRQLQVQVDPQRLREKNVSLLQILETTGNAMWVSTLSFVEASTPGTGGFIETNNQRLGIRHIFPISSPQGLAQVPVEGTTLRLGEVANVVEDHQPLIGDAIGSDGPSLLLVVEKLPGANTLEVTRGVESALAALRPGLPGVAVDASIYRPATFIEMALANLARAVLLGSLLGILVVSALLFEWRSVVISLVAVPCAMIAAALVLYVRGASINAMVLAGLAVALGVVIQDAIVGVDAVARRLAQHRLHGSPGSVRSVIVEASLEARGAIVYGTLIVVLAVVPAFFIGGLSGGFFMPLLLSYVLAILTSSVVALIVTPALSFILLGHAPREPRASPVVSWLQRRYHQALIPVIRSPRLALALAGALVLVAVGGLPFMRAALVPPLKEPNLLIHLDGAPGTGRTEMNRIVARASEELRSTPGVSNVGAHVGRAMLSDRKVAVNSTEMWVTIDSAANYESTVAAVQRVVDGYPGLQRTVGGYLDERSSGLAAADTNALTVRVFGENATALRDQADKVKEALNSIGGIFNTEILLPVEEPTLEIKVDLAAAQQYGLKPGDIRRAAATLLSGIQAGNLFDEQKVFDVVVWGTPETRASITSIRDLLMDTPDGGHVRLADVASVNVVPARTSVRHEAVRSYLDIRADVSGRPLPAVATDIERRLQDVRFPLEYHAEVVGDYVVREAAQNRTLGLAVAAALGVFLLMQAAFGSWRLAALAFVTVPAALAGGVVVILAGGGILSLGGLIGVVAIFGIAARNMVVLISHLQRLERTEGERFGPELILRGTREQLSLVLTTGCATAVGLLPFAMFGDIAGLEIVRPMTMVVLGGLVTSTVLNLFIVPAIYLRFGGSAEPAPATVRTAALQYAGVGGAAD
jgi:Cu/Ag efflux pump CusA